MPNLAQLASRLVQILIIVLLASCGGGGGSSNPSTSGNTGGTSSDSWVAGVFLPASTFDAMCAVPVPGTSDRQGTATDENNFLRSYSNDTYLWFNEIVDRNPALHTTPAYFDLLKTTALTPSGKAKDKFHFTIPTDEWIALSQAGESVGYGAQFVILPPRDVRVAYTEPGTPATAAGANLVRGERILFVDGENVLTSNNVDALNAGTFPETAGESHTFRVLALNGTERTITMQSAVITSDPVKNVSIINTATGRVGYLLFNDHIATAEGELYNAINQLATPPGITDLVIDIRYNGGGYLDIASELAYMIAGNAQTAGRTFELIKFNSKHPLVNPVTGETLVPIPFYNRSLGFDPSLPAGTVLPPLNLSRVYVLTGSGTCSASESIINSLRGVDVQVIQVGSTTCGKPYGFYGTNNCGTTYFTIQFQGVNAKGFGDYTDGFAPANTMLNVGTLVPGCAVHDDFSRALGDPAESRLAAALAHRQTGSCQTIASGFSRSSAMMKQSLPPGEDEDMVVPKSTWQQNRIMSR